MSRHTPVATVFIALCVHLAPAAAQNAYKCGETYSQQPCPGGKLVATDDRRTEEQRAQAEAAARRDAKAADAKETKRLKEEGKPAQAILPPDKPPATAERPADKPLVSKAKKQQYFTAVAPLKPGEKPVKKKKKAAKKDKA